MQKHSKNIKQLVHKKIINHEELYLKNGLIDIIKLKSYFQHDRLISMKELQKIMSSFHHLIKNQPNISYVNQPVIIISDIHGQYTDFLKVLAMIIQTLQNKGNIIFLGDYVDRGNNSVEVIVLLMCIKIIQPKNIIMLRGNHQSQRMTEVYGFKQQCLNKYSEKVYNQFLDIFNCLPLACIVNHKYFCVHGGVSDKLTKITDLNKLNRLKQLDPQTELFDCMWADPSCDEKGWMNKQCQYNTTRSCSIAFGSHTAAQFLAQNKLHCIVRGHEVFKQGYRLHYSETHQQNPIAITIFSAPNYCGTHGNLATIMNIKNNQIIVFQFKQEQITSDLPESIQNIQWSLSKLLWVVNNTLKYLIKRIVHLYIPELKNIPIEVIIKILLIYFKHCQAKKKLCIKEEQNMSNFILTMKKQILKNNKQQTK